MEKEWSELVKPRLLVVDDEKNIRDMLRRHFVFLGYDVDVAENGAQALEFMKAVRFEVMISDISMPGMSGVDLLKEVHREYPMTHCIMITGYVTMDNVLRCMRYGADTCIFKPIEDLVELEQAVRRAVDELKHWQSKLKSLIRMKPRK